MSDLILMVNHSSAAQSLYASSFSAYPSALSDPEWAMPVSDFSNMLLGFQRPLGNLPYLPISGTGGPAGREAPLIDGARPKTPVVIAVEAEVIP
jgi:hypothetical protein